MSRVALAMAFVACGFLTMVATSSCLGDTATGIVTTACVPFDSQDLTDPFVNVSEVLERRCATLDCHGAASRPLRIYGNAGPRRPAPALGTEERQKHEYCP